MSTAAYRRSNRERIRERARAYRETHQDRLREYNAEYYRDHRHARPRHSRAPAPRDSILRFGPRSGSEKERRTRLEVATLVMRAFVAADLDPSPDAKAYFREALNEDRALERLFEARAESRLAAGQPRLVLRHIAVRRIAVRRIPNLALVPAGDATLPGI